MSRRVVFRKGGGFRPPPSYCGPKARDYFKQNDLARECRRYTEEAARVAIELIGETE